MIDFRSLRFGCEVESVGQTRHTVAQAIQSVVGGEVTHVGTPSAYDPWEALDSRGRTWKVAAAIVLRDESIAIIQELRRYPILVRALYPAPKPIIHIAGRQIRVGVCSDGAEHIVERVI